MRKSTTVIRIILGILMIVFGLNSFLHFMPVPKPSPEMGAFLGALAKTGYIFPLISAIEINAGGLLLINIAVPLALTLLSPVLVNAFLAHLFLQDIGGIGAAALTITMTGFLIFTYRQTFFKLINITRYENA